MKELRDQVLMLILNLTDAWVETGDERFKVMALEIERGWIRLFSNLNDPDPRVPKAGVNFDDTDEDDSLVNYH